MFAVRIIRLVDKLPNTSAGRAIGNQIVSSGTSPGANYRAACVGKYVKGRGSTPELHLKLLG